MKKIKNYSLTADVVRVLAIFGVVIIHTANSVFERPDFFGGISWWVALVLNSVSRIAVPVFIMLSGYFLLRKDQPFSLTLQRVIGRLVIPLVFWVILSYLVSNPTHLSEIFNIKFYLRFFSGNVFQYYFLVILIGLYFVSPFIRSFIKNEPLALQKKVAAILVGVGIAEAVVKFATGTCNLESAFTRWIPFAGLFIMGYLVTNGSYKKIDKKWYWLTYLIGLTVTVIAGYVYYSKGSLEVFRSNLPGCISHYSDYYLSINVVAMAISAYFLLFSTNFEFIKKFKLQDTVFNISRMSYAIYLVHLMVVTFWDKVIGWDVDHAMLPLWLYLFFRIFGVFFISYLISRLLSKFKLTSWLIGGI